ncbi:Lrp/AsnC family transcriptional regulator [Nocardiopsis deserti]|uniref:Lrp/AsnC family transcriptional regulator n=1 Tax=Nocardiopsis deserti TaxID=2605988 RepID=UPI00123C6C4B|nr:Lrp/AsnC family transcriptional regulator [Nocardiopsis deserti]
MDDIDSRILGILRENGRISFSALGTAVGLSTNAAAARVRRLERNGTIVGYQAVLADGFPLAPCGLEAYVDVRLESGIDYDTFLARIADIPEIHDAVHMTGPHDYLLHVFVPGTAALDHLLRRLKQHSGAAQTHTRIALREVRPRNRRPS